MSNSVRFRVILRQFGSQLFEYKYQKTVQKGINIGKHAYSHHFFLRAIMNVFIQVIFPKYDFIFR